MRGRRGESGPRRGAEAKARKPFEPGNELDCLVRGGLSDTGHVGERPVKV